MSFSLLSYPGGSVSSILCRFLWSFGTGHGIMKKTPAEVGHADRKTPPLAPRAADRGLSCSLRRLAVPGRRPLGRGQAQLGLQADLAENRNPAHRAESALRRLPGGAAVPVPGLERKGCPPHLSLPLPPALLGLCTDRPAAGHPAPLLPRKQEAAARLWDHRRPGRRLRPSLHAGRLLHAAAGAPLLLRGAAPCPHPHAADPHQRRSRGAGLAAALRRPPAAPRCCGGSSPSPRSSALPASTCC